MTETNGAAPAYTNVDKDGVPTFKNDSDLLEWTALLMKEEHGWNTSDTARAIGFKNGTGIHNYSSGRSLQLPKTRRERVRELLRLAQTAALDKRKLPRPAAVIPTSIPLTQETLEMRRKRRGEPAEAEAPETLGTLRDVLELSCKDARRIANRLTDRIPHAPTLIQPGLRDAVKAAEQLAKLLQLD